MPYYNPPPVQGAKVRPRKLNTVGVSLLALFLLALIVSAVMYGPGYCGVVTGTARQGTVLVLADGGSIGAGRASTGFIINSQGYVLTVPDPLEDAQAIQVVVGSGTREAKVLDAWPVVRRGLVQGANSSGSEWTVLQVDVAEPLVALEIENSDLLRVEDRVTAVGFSSQVPSNPQDEGPTPTVGSGRITGLQQAEITSDCDLIDGSPGGPLLNRDGRVVGLIVEAGSDGCVAVPTASLTEVWTQFVTGQR